MAYKSISDSGVLNAALDAPPSDAHRPGGWAISEQGEPYIIDLASDPVPAGATFLGGLAFKTDGALYCTSDAPSSPQIINGQAVRNDGALHITTSAPEGFLGRWGHTADGKACVEPYVRAVVEGMLVDGATFTRADSATYFDSDGIMQTASANEARTTYIGGNPYVWLDGAVTEISGRSGDLDNWPDGIATVAKDAVGLDGNANTGFTLTDDNDAAFESRDLDTTITSGTNTYYWVAAIADVDNPTAFPRLNIRLTGGTQILQGITLDPSDGSFSEPFTSGDVVLEPIKVGGFWHFVLSITDNGSGNTIARSQAFPCVSNTDINSASSSATGSTEWGYVGLFKDAFSLMPVLTTGGTTATVAADVASLANSVIAGLTEGTLYMEIWSPQLTSNAARHIAELQTDANNFIRVFHETDGDLDAQVTDGGASQAALAGTDLTVGTLQKVALTFKANEFSLYRDGSQLATDTSGTMPSVDTLLIGAGLYGGIKTMNVHTTAWSQAKAESETT